MRNMTFEEFFACRDVFLEAGAQEESLSLQKAGLVLDWAWRAHANAATQLRHERNRLEFGAYDYNKQVTVHTLVKWSTEQLQTICDRSKPFRKRVPEGKTDVEIIQAEIDRVQTAANYLNHTLQILKERKKGYERARTTYIPEITIANKRLIKEDDPMHPSGVFEIASHFYMKEDDGSITKDNEHTIRKNPLAQTIDQVLSLPLP